MPSAGHSSSTSGSEAASPLLLVAGAIGSSSDADSAGAATARRSSVSGASPDVVRERHGHGRRQRQHVLPGLQRLGEQGGEATAHHEAGLGVDALEEHAEPAVPEPRDDVPGRQPGAGAASERVECGLRGAAADGRRQLVEALQGDDEQAHPAADHA